MGWMRVGVRAWGMLWEEVNLVRTPTNSLPRQPQPQHPTLPAQYPPLPPRCRTSKSPSRNRHINRAPPPVHLRLRLLQPPPTVPPYQSPSFPITSPLTTRPTSPQGSSTPPGAATPTCPCSWSTTSHSPTGGGVRRQRERDVDGGDGGGGDGGTRGNEGRALRKGKGTVGF